jgi:hypothetical protein
MSAPDQPATSPTRELPGPQDWSEADLAALFASDMWLAMKAPRELIERYKGMHVAIVGEQIVDGDRDLTELGRRLDAMGDAVPMNRLLIRYIQTDEEAIRLGY